MLIRTQDKRSLVDMTGHTISINQKGRHYLAKRINLSNDFDYNNVEHSCIYCIECNGTNGTLGNILGRYSTEEKAIKVLDMIRKTYESTTSQLSTNGLLITPCNKVFDMPDDEEVEV
jgi:hypothetical protein